MTQSMTAAVYEQYGSPEVVQIKTVPVPEYAEDEVLIRVHYSTVNRTDCGFLRAKPFIVRFFSGLTKPKNTILGSEFAGEVVATGATVTDFAIGDRVFGFTDEVYGFGGHAQFNTMSDKGLLAKIPAHFSYEEAAAGMEGSHYALSDIRALGIDKKHRVLINGATGAIGSAAVQLIHALGAEVTAVCATPYMDTVAKLGAHRVIDYLNEDFTQLDEQFDAVFDSVGKSSFGQCKRILKDDGVYLSTELGAYCQNPLFALLTPIFSKQQVKFPLPRATRADADYIASAMHNKQFKPLIDRTYPLHQIQDAFHYVETGEKIGNVLIEIPPVE